MRRSPILLKLPPYLSAICILVGIVWVLLLPLNDYSRQTYISENAILPGQVHTYFGGSEHNIFRAYRQEVYNLGQKSREERLAGIEQIIKEIKLKSATQEYAFEVAGEKIEGRNVYGLLQGPRADATEAMVLIAAWKNFEGELNYSGVALALTLARYFKRWSIWSKDIILLIPEDSTYGSEAWVSAYHSTGTTPTSSRNVSDLPIKAGALQGAIALDYPVGPWGKRFEKLDVLYDGINGALPNLDLINTAVQIASGHMGMGCSLHGFTKHSDKYPDRLRTIASGILSQAQGVATGPHSAFMPYHVDAITLKTVGDGWHDEMSLGRVTESIFRSINNLLEHLHQSFFFYILLNTHRFVSIGSYLPAAMLVAGSFTINALALWILSGKGPVEKPGKLESAGGQKPKSEKMVKIKEGDKVAVVAKEELQSVERKMFLPAVVVLAAHLISLVPLYLLTHTSKAVSARKSIERKPPADIVAELAVCVWYCHNEQLHTSRLHLDPAGSVPPSDIATVADNAGIFATLPRGNFLDLGYTQFFIGTNSGSVGMSAWICASTASAISKRRQWQTAHTRHRAEHSLNLAMAGTLTCDCCLCVQLVCQDGCQRGTI